MSKLNFPKQRILKEMLVLFQIKERAVQFLRKAEYLIRKLNNSIGSEGGWLGWSLLDFMRLMLISTQVEVVFEVELDKNVEQLKTEGGKL